MYRIDNSSAATTLPAPSAPGPNPVGYFTGGVPGSGVLATRVDAEWLNMTQEEIANVILAAGIILNKGDRTQLLQAIRGLARRRLVAPLSLYVSTSGNDTTGDGLSSGTAWATPQQAWSWIHANLDLGNQTVTVNLAPGSYPPINAVGIIPGAQPGAVVFAGVSGNPSQVTISGTNQAAVAAQAGAIVHVEYLTLTSSGTPSGQVAPAGYGLIATPQSRIDFDNISFGACGYAHVGAAGGGNVDGGGGAYTIAGPSQYHYYVTEGGQINVIGATVTVNATPNFSQAFASADTLGALMNWSCTFTGAATGTRYSSTNNAIIDIQGAPPNTYYPGNAIGRTQNGGLVI